MSDDAGTPRGRGEEDPSDLTERAAERFTVWQGMIDRLFEPERFTGEPWDLHPDLAEWVQGLRERGSRQARNVVITGPPGIGDVAGAHRHPDRFRWRVGRGRGVRAPETVAAGHPAAGHRVRAAGVGGHVGAHPR